MAISLEGGLFKFIRGSKPEMNIMEKVEANFDNLELMLINTNKTRNSKLLIENVMKLKQDDI